MLGLPTDVWEILQLEYIQVPPPVSLPAGTSALSPDLLLDNFQPPCFSSQPVSFWPEIQVIARNASFTPLKMAQNLTNLACKEITAMSAHRQNICLSAHHNCFSMFAYNFP